MSNAQTKTILDTYNQMPMGTGFLTSLSTTRTFDTETFEYDALREGEDIAIAVQHLGDDGRWNEASQFTNKEIAVPVFKETAALNAFDKFAREPGRHPFESNGVQGAMSRRALDVMGKMGRKISRSLELQHAQALQGGVISLVDAAGGVKYSIDYKMKASHKVTVGTTWAGGAGAPLADLEAMFNQVRRDGQARVEKAVFGRLALADMLADADVLARLDNRALMLGEINTPQVAETGGVYHGRLSVGTHNVEVWSYENDYIDPQTGNLTPYIAETKVIALARGVDMLSAFGDVPVFAPPSAPALIYMPNRLSRPGMDMFPDAWLSLDRQTLHLQVTSRPVAALRSPDRVAVLTTRP